MSVITLALTTMCTLADLTIDLTPEGMTCSDAGSPAGDKYDEDLTWEKSGYFFNGMESYHRDLYEDRRFTIRYCTTNPSIVKDEQTLPTTKMDASWKRGCGGGTAITYAFSTHNNKNEDRDFKFKCAAISNRFILGSCEWIGYYPAQFDGSFHKDCPNNGIIRTIESYHDNKYEDRKFKFECCRVYQNPYYYIPMDCVNNDFYTNEWNSGHDEQLHNYFISGMYSEHNNYYEDRKYKWRFCKPKTTGSYVGQEQLDQTDWDDRWTQSCNVFNGGHAAMIRVQSVHDNTYQDRRFTFTCGVLDNEEYQLVNCGWTGNLNEYDSKLDFYCPNSGVIRGIDSWHRDLYEDRQFRFECCNIAERNYEFTNMEGYWQQVASVGGSGSISKSISTGIERTSGSEVTNEFSLSLSVAVSNGYEFKGASSSIEITTEIAASTATTISQSFTEYAENTISVTCAEGVQYLYQFVMESVEAVTYTHQYRCTNIPYPKCGPGFFDCVPNDPNCNKCKSNWPSS